MVFAILTNDEGDITLLSYDWQCTVTLTAATQRSFNLWNENRPNFSWQSEVLFAAQLLERLLLGKGFWLTIREFSRFEDSLRKLCEPGPPLSSAHQLRFTAEKV